MGIARACVQVCLRIEGHGERGVFGQGRLSQGQASVTGRDSLTSCTGRGLGRWEGRIIPSGTTSLRGVVILRTHFLFQWPHSQVGVASLVQQTRGSLNFLFFQNGCSQHSTLTRASWSLPLSTACCHHISYRLPTADALRGRGSAHVGGEGVADVSKSRCGVGQGGVSSYGRPIEPASGCLIPSLLQLPSQSPLHEDVV